MLNTVSKIRGQVKSPGYPQSEGLLGECMIRHGKELGSESNFGEAAGWHGDVGMACVPALVCGAAPPSLSSRSIFVLPSPQTRAAGAPEVPQCHSCGSPALAPLLVQGKPGPPLLAWGKAAC